MMDSTISISNDFNFEESQRLVESGKNIPVKEIVSDITQTGDVYNVIKVMNGKCFILTRQDPVRDSFVTNIETRKEVDVMTYDEKIKRVYSTVIILLVSMIAMSILFLLTNFLKIPKEVSASAILFLSTALVAFVIEKKNFLKSIENG